MFRNRFSRLSRVIRNASAKPALGRPFEVAQRTPCDAPALYNPFRDLDGMDRAATIRAQALAARLQLART